MEPPRRRGKRIYPSVRTISLRDHPRVGGEKSCSRSIIMRRKGSPPRGRGKARAARLRWKGGGITPAWAGKSFPVKLVSRQLQDHPRMGGEKTAALSLMFCQKGSPPRRQGKANWHCVRRPALRITPAHAGKRTRSWRAYGCPWDHPRVGGEKSTFLNSMSFPPGSPPRGRGKEVVEQRSPKPQGITPA